MRITGGRYRGRIILCPPGTIRPAMDRMRESLFSILGDLDGQSFLDLFSGSGIVGIEAASRGAQPVHLVEMDHHKRHTIERNMQCVETDIKLFTTDVLHFMHLAKQQYDIVYADPPFSFLHKIRLAQLAATLPLVAPGGLFIIHYPREEHSDWPQRIGGLTCIDERRYGRSTLRFYRYETEAIEHDH